MTEKEIKSRYKEICQNLSERKLKPAFDLIENLIKESGLVIFLDEWRNLEQTYSYMLKYTVEGIQDPERQKIYRKLIVSVFKLADKIKESALYKISSSIEYEKKRVFPKEKLNLENYLLELDKFYIQEELELLSENEKEKNTDREKLKHHQEKIKHLFFYFWFQDELSTAELDFIYRFYASKEIPVSYKSLVVSSLILSLFRYFDEEKISVLFDLYELDEDEVSQRAFIGLLLALYKYDLRLSFYPAILGRLKMLNENPGFKQNLERLIIQLIRSRETEKIQKKIKDEIIPEMIKISPNLKDKINLDSLMDEGLGEDKNPEWEKLFEDSPGLMNKMEEFSELQMEGADVFMGSFSMLKLFPFFNEISNWFMPFFPENPDILTTIDQNDAINSRFIKAINSAPILCNSDKYSFCLSIQNLPPENR